MPATAEQFQFTPEEIRTRREDLGLSREHFAIVVGRSSSTVIAWELGTRSPSERVRPILAAALGVGPDPADAPAAARRAVADWVARSRAASGVPRHVEDPAAIERVARVLP